MAKLLRLMPMGFFIALAATSGASAQYSGSYRGGGGTHWGSSSRATSNLLLNRSIQAQRAKQRQRLARNAKATPAAQKKKSLQKRRPSSGR